MKRFLSVIIAGIMIFSLAACGNANGGAAGENGAAVDPLEVLETVWGSYSDDEKFPAAGGDYDHSVDGAPGSFDVSSTENLNYLLSVPEDSAPMIKSAASLMHMMNSNTFTCGAMLTDSADDAAKLAEAMRGSIQSKHWMCGFPDKLVVITLDSCVISMYGLEDIINTFRDKLLAAYDGAAVVYDEAIEW